MCAIVGLVDYEERYPTRVLRDLTRAMRDTMAHRGPDDAGLWTSPDGRVCLGHRRLSIIDPRPEGRQPMANEDGRVLVTFNGEIYNFRSLAADLANAGHRFVSRTDTEVLCHLFEDGDPAESRVPSARHVRLRRLARARSANWCWPAIISARNPCITCATVP